MLPAKCDRGCVNCGRTYKEHADEKCLFEATAFKANSWEMTYMEVVEAGGPQKEKSEREERIKRAFGLYLLEYENR